MEVIPRLLRIGFTFACDAQSSGREIGSIEGEGMTGMTDTITTAIVSGP
jgi:hypothetical protein